MISEVIKFLTTDIWRIRSRDLPRSRWFLIRLLRILILSIRGLIEDRGPLRASALTFWSSLSVVPVVAMLFGIAKGFGFERNLERQLLEKLEGQEEVVSWIIKFAHTTLETARGGVIAGLGILFLFWTIIKVLGNIEHSFNDIWGVKKGRPIARKITDYLSLMLIGPVLFMMSSTATLLITSQVKVFVHKISLLGAVSPVIFLVLRLLPYAVIWVLFVFMYIFMPNTKVRFRSGVLAGIIAGTLYQIFQWTYIIFQIGVAKYNAIYGGFAALPLFLIWLQVSWLIVLFGAEIAFAHQNVDTYEFEPDCLRVSHSFKRLLSLRIVHLLVKDFSNGERWCDETEISHKLEIPIRLVRQILFELVESGIISPVKVDDDKASAYQPALNPEAITIKFVVDALEQQGSDDIPVARSEELEKLSQSMKTFDELIKGSPANLRLKDI
ncbi:MAG: YihY family inner membrane protein [Deltaproteobacteria bacterium]|nr:MAG: YihY family inner membrane protein [Deltaproteobacteria bacterium]